LHQGGVGVGPGHHLPGGHAVQVGEVHGLEMVVHGVAQVVLDGQCHPSAAVAPDIGKPEGGYGEADENGQPGPQGRGVGDDDVVDDLALYQRHQGLTGAAEHGGPQR
jgi:hypothetical protein